jgi:hypothetical protein
VINNKFGLYPAIRVERLGFAHLIAGVELQTCFPQEQTIALFKVFSLFENQSATSLQFDLNSPHDFFILLRFLLAFQTLLVVV